MRIKRNLISLVTKVYLSITNFGNLPEKIKCLNSRTLVTGKNGVI